MKTINVDGSDESSDWIHFMRFESDGDKPKKDTKLDKPDKSNKPVKKIEIDIRKI